MHGIGSNNGASPGMWAHLLAGSKADNLQQGVVRQDRQDPHQATTAGTPMLHQNRFTVSPPLGNLRVTMTFTSIYDSRTSFGLPAEKILSSRAKI